MDTDKQTLDEYKPLCHVVTPIGMLGYGFDEEETNRGIEHGLSCGIPTALIVDSGSTDSGPTKLALGSMTVRREGYVRDMTKLIRAVCKYRVPLMIGSAGGDGSDAHVRDFMEMIGKIVATLNHGKFILKVLAIYSGVPHSTVLRSLAAGKISGCGNSVPGLTAEEVEGSPTIVGQMGAESFLSAMCAHPDFDIIVGGRAYDPSPYVAFCAYHALRQEASRQKSIHSLENHKMGGFVHMGKVMECGAMCATPKSRSAMATVYPDGVFDVWPLQVGAVCTPSSVAAHTLYEKSRPDLLFGPGGYIDLRESSYEPLPDSVGVRVHGTIFISSKSQGEAYTVKIEGARVIGHRSIIMGSFADPILISHLDMVLAQARQYTASQHDMVDQKWDLQFHTYGLYPPSKEGELPSAPGPVFVIGEALADTQDRATSIASTARIACIHGPYPGQKATSGNFGMGIGALTEIEAGPCAVFSIYHLMEIEEGQECSYERKVNPDCLFTWDMSWIGSGERPQAGTVPRPQWPDNDNAMHANLRTMKVQPTASTGSKSAAVTIGDVAKVVRSKNAGPFEVTFDVIFEDHLLYSRVKKLGVLNSQRIAEIFSIAREDIVYCGFFDQALAFKATIPRMREGRLQPSGGYMEDDVHGSQKYLPLVNIKLDLEI